jgi:predicted flap endonuclease-1-like 5' DNA nuclease
MWGEVHEKTVSDYRHAIRTHRHSVRSGEHQHSYPDRTGVIAKAKAIVDHRKKNGSFKSIDDLQNVSGIGPATMKRLRKDVTVGTTSAVKKEAKAPAK